MDRAFICATEVLLGQILTCEHNHHFYSVLTFNFVGRLFRHALEDSRPKSALVHSLSVSISLHGPKRLTLGLYHTYSRHLNHESVITANPETVEGMLDSFGKVVSLDVATC